MEISIKAIGIVVRQRGLYKMLEEEFRENQDVEYI